MRAIVAADENWGIGKDNKLLISIPQDMKFFRNETAGKVILMGRNTLESFPNKRPLPGRKNIVLSKDPDYKVKDALVVHSVKEALAAVAEYDPANVYCIGGASVYKEMLPYCDTVFVTRIYFRYDADAYFPDLDKDGHFALVARSEEQIYFDLTYEFLRYERV